jgi:hypothetical protein
MSQLILNRLNLTRLNRLSVLPSSILTSFPYSLSSLPCRIFSLSSPSGFPSRFFSTTRAPLNLINQAPDNHHDPSILQPLHILPHEGHHIPRLLHASASQKLHLIKMKADSSAELSSIWAGGGRYPGERFLKLETRVDFLPVEGNLLVDRPD